MNTSNARHPFALPALVLSILITSTMALLPAVAGIGANPSARDTHAIQTAVAASQDVAVVS